jgi:hypothetical protein
MSDSDHAHRDARDCPQCGARGILPLDQEPCEGAAPGTIKNPVMPCPVCGKRVPRNRYDLAGCD